MTTESNVNEKTDIKVIEKCQISYIALQNLIYENVICSKSDDFSIANSVNCLRNIVQSFFDDDRSREKFEKVLIKQCEFDNKKQIIRRHIHANQLESTETKLINGIKVLIHNGPEKIEYEII